MGRDKNERTALFRKLVQALLIHGTIETSEAKSKAVKGLVDKIINLAKDKNTHYLLRAFLVQENLVDRLIKEIAPKLSDRTSGYTSTVKVGYRAGDNSRMVRMSIIGAEELEPMKNIKDQISKIKTKEKKIATHEKKEEVKKTVKVTKPVRKVAKKK